MQSTPSFGTLLYSNTTWSCRLALSPNLNPDSGPWQSVDPRYSAVEPWGQTLMGEGVVLVEAVVVVFMNNIFNLMLQLTVL